jgi:hypothetical protein
MSYAFVQDVPADEQLYRRIRAEIGDEDPKGLVAHLALKRDGGLRYIDVWDSEEDWLRFRDGRVEPAVAKVLTEAGFTELPPHPEQHELELVDVWLGS